MCRESSRQDTGCHKKRFLYICSPLLVCKTLIIVEMKKAFVAIMAIAALGLASCQKSETPAPSATLSEQVAGNYGGNMTITVGETPSEPIAQDIKITENGDSAIDLTITDFSFSGLDLGNISLTDCALTKNGEDGTISVSAQKTVSLELVGDCSVELTGTFDDDKATLKLGISPSILPMNVSVLFEGTKTGAAE